MSIKVNKSSKHSISSPSEFAVDKMSDFIACRRSMITYILYTSCECGVEITAAPLTSAQRDMRAMCDMDGGCYRAVGAGVFLNSHGSLSEAVCGHVR